MYDLLATTYSGGGEPRLRLLLCTYYPAQALVSSSNGSTQSKQALAVRASGRRAASRPLSSCGPLRPFGKSDYRIQCY